MNQSRKSGKYCRFEAGPSDRGYPASRNIELGEIWVDSPSSDCQESALSIATPKRKPRKLRRNIYSQIKRVCVSAARPLNLADDYEIVGGVPAFVWKPYEDDNPSTRVYAISPDGISIAIQEGMHKICVYDMLDNFSLVAEWEDSNYKRIWNFSFHNDLDNELVVVFCDSTVAMMHLSIKSMDPIDKAKTSQQKRGSIEITQEFLVLGNIKDENQLFLGMASEGCETWVFAWDHSIRSNITLLSIAKKSSKRLHIKSSFSTVPTCSYISISQRVLMFVSAGQDSNSWKTTIYRNVNFTDKVFKGSQETLEYGKSFGFSECGRYFLVWRCVQVEENAIELYEVQSFTKSLYPVARRSIGRNVVIARGCFIKGDIGTIASMGGDSLDYPIVAFLVARKFHVRLAFWEPSSEEILKEIDLAMSEISTLDVPSHILNNKAYEMDRVGAFNDLLINRSEGNIDIITNVRKSSNKLGVKLIHQRAGDPKVKAIIKVVCFGNIAKMGSQGILRFLILQQAPAYIFKTPIVKWTVLYKWEHFWKRMSVRRLVQFVVALGAFTLYVGCIGLSRHSLKNNVALQVCTSLILITIMGFVMAMLREEAMQFKTYMIDGKKLFDNNNSRELLTYVILIFLIVPMHFLSFHYTSLFPFLYVVLAIESILMWFKVWYFLQAFSETGALVLMIENVIRDCIPFLILSGVVLLGFSIGLFAMFQDVIQISNSIKLEEDDGQEENETHQKIVSSFESPQKAILTLFYAMIGTFDVEVYFESGRLSPIIVLFFVLYLSIQAIVMFNMLIAIMSDTFDKVKSTEEEQLLMGRAQFIDACEAALTKNQRKRMNEKIGEYMYILFSKDEDANKESIMWHGRINNIKDNVKKELRESQTRILEEIKSLEQRTKDESAQALATLEESLERKMTAEMLAMEERIKTDIATILEHLKTSETH
eukprot:g7463.t1